jgi:mannose-6-phosphate isomerase-like protein (cupin superfamily)
MLKWAAGSAAAFPFLAAAAGGQKLPDGVRGTGEGNLRKESFGDLTVYYDGPTDQLKAMTAGSLLLKPGMSPHPPHEHPEEEIMVITQGTGEINVGGKITRVGPGAMMYCAGNKSHGIVNTGTTPLLFYYYKWLV